MFHNTVDKKWSQSILIYFSNNFIMQRSKGKEKVGRIRNVASQYCHKLKNSVIFIDDRYL